MNDDEIERARRRHRFLKDWLVRAQALIASTATTLPLHSEDGGFTILDVPRALWEPRVQAKITQFQTELTNLEALATTYVNAAGS